MAGAPDDGRGRLPEGEGSDVLIAAAPAEGAPQPAPSIALSWRRCAALGIDRHRAGPLPSPTIGAADDQAAASRTLALVRPAIEDVYQFVEGSKTAIGYVDADARLRELVGDDGLLAELAGLGCGIGSCWSESAAGTNGAALAILESFPIQVCGEEHYCAFLAPYCTAAAPVHDSLGGLVGALVAIAPARSAHPHTLGMVSAAAAALTSELRMNLWLGSANELLLELNAILQTLAEGILLLQADGTVTQMNARAGRILGLAPASVTGRRLADVIAVPPVLADALRLGRELHDDEVTFRVGGAPATCLCTLRGIAAPEPLSARSPAAPFSEAAGLAQGAQRTSGLKVAPRRIAGSFVLTLRSIERVQRLVHRMSGAQARMRFSNMIGESAALLEAARLARIAAESGSTVLLHGETGTGKEVFAQSIHNASARADGPFVAINCAAIPRELISSELFGYEGGAFTGADRHGRPGKFELANGGTLFLDEIGDMPRDLQTSLLRAIETRTVVRVGGQNVTPVDVRIIAATHRDLAEEVRLGTFRSDLFFRLDVFPIEVPALRERPGDVPVLLRHVLQRLSTRLDRALDIEAEALAALEAYPWPGNVRELENVIERAVYVADRGGVALADLPAAIQAAWRAAQPQAFARAHFGALGATPRPDPPPAPVTTPARDLRRESRAAEILLIQRALQTCDGNVTQAARLLGISRTTLWRKLRGRGVAARTLQDRNTSHD